MTFYAVFRKADSGLVSTGTSVVDPKTYLDPTLDSVQIAALPDASVQWDPATKTFVPHVVTKVEVEAGQLQAPYERWLRWKTSLTEAQVRNVAAAVITALSNQTDAAWQDYAAAVTAWKNAQ